MLSGFAAKLGVETFAPAGTRLADALGVHFRGSPPALDVPVTHWPPFAIVIAAPEEHCDIEATMVSHHATPDEPARLAELIYELLGAPGSRWNARALTTRGAERAGQ